MDEELTGDVFDILRRGRVDRGHAIVLDPRNGRLLAYASTDRENFPAERAYPAASIVKILTAAAMLEEGEGHDSAACIYRGNKYRLNRRRLDRPSSGRESSLEDALASSNNQCFSQSNVLVGCRRPRLGTKRAGSNKWSRGSTSAAWAVDWTVCG
jgi:cell division protein FtsI/penicillin-binding protein 2